MSVKYKANVLISLEYSEAISIFQRSQYLKSHSLSKFRRHKSFHYPKLCGVKSLVLLEQTSKSWAWVHVWLWPSEPTTDFKQLLLIFLYNESARFTQ